MIYYYYKQGYGERIYVPAGEEVMESIDKLDNETTFYFKNRGN